MSHSLSDAARLLQEALLAIDAEMTNLQCRLHADAHSLRVGIDHVDLSDSDRASLLLILDRMEVTAESVANFAHRSSCPPPTLAE